MPFTDTGAPISKYNGEQGFYDAYNSVSRGRRANDGDIALLEQYGDQFKSLFRNYVGRDPISSEVGQFFSQVVSPQGKFEDQQKFRDRTASYVGDTFQQAAEQQTVKELEGQKSQANDLAGLFRTQGAQTVNDYQSKLMDFTQKLVERVRPNLITSMQAQGLLNSGGLNQAIAGQQADFSNQAAQQVADLQLQNDQQANAISFGGASAPYEYQKAMSMNRVPNLMAAGQQGLQNAYQTQAASNNYSYQMGLLNRQAEIQRSQKQGFGSNLANSFSTSLGGSLGNSLGQWFSPAAAKSAAGGV